MRTLKSEFPSVRSVKVLIEERRIDLEVNPANWRTHQYKGFEELPQRIRPAFASPGTDGELDLVALIRQACSNGAPESRFEVPYQDGTGREKKTVLRTVVVHLYFQRQARAGICSPSRCAAVAMPMVADGVWSRFELHQVEMSLRDRYSKLSSSLIALIVRLAALDVQPRQGRAKLQHHSVSLLEKRQILTLN
jgi:hypothetical protein